MYVCMYKYRFGVWGRSGFVYLSICFVSSCVCMRVSVGERLIIGILRVLGKQIAIQQQKARVSPPSDVASIVKTKQKVRKKIKIKKQRKRKLILAIAHWSEKERISSTPTVIFAFTVRRNEKRSEALICVYVVRNSHFFFFSLTTLRSKHILKKNY